MRSFGLTISAAILIGGGVIVSNLFGCSPATLNNTVAQGQLFCAIATATGPLVIALADQLGAPILVTGKLASAVAADCALVNGIPTTPPANPAQAPKVATAIFQEPAGSPSGAVHNGKP
jgi:hypothetical protein